MKSSALALAAVMLVGAAPMTAVAKERPLDRGRAIRRARNWTNQRVPYSQAGHRDGYRRDCSGFVSMAWDLPENLTTWRIPLVAKRIGKKDLKPGDVLLNHRARAGYRHVVMFEKWANPQHTKYVVVESTGQSGIDGAVRRTVEYPYRIGGTAYKPYRYVSMDRYYRALPASERQPVHGYDGRVETPRQKAARLKAERLARRHRAAEKAAAKKAAERKVAEKVAAKKAAAEKAAKTQASLQGVQVATVARLGLFDDLLRVFGL